MKTTQVLAVAGLLASTGASDPNQDVMWYVDGVKGFYDGYYKSLYKQNMDEDMKKCLNDETIGNMVDLANVLAHPFDIFSDFSKGMDIIKEGTEVLNDVQECKFLQSWTDIDHFCKEDLSNCSMTKMTENLSKNMFVIIGKLTSLTETMKDFPSPDPETYADQMYEIGDDAGTMLRTLYNFHTGSESAESHVYRHHNNY